MFNIRKQSNLDLNRHHYFTTVIRVISLALGLSLGSGVLGTSLQLLALVHAPATELERDATIATPAALPSLMKQAIPQEGAAAFISAQAAPESAFNFPQNFIPPGDGRPDNTRGSGARRVSCASAAGIELEADAKGIYPLMPSEDYGLTFQSHPTIFLHFDGDFAPMVFLRVESESGDYSELATLPVMANQPIQGFALPGDRPPLAIGENYLWTLMVACDGDIKPYHPLFTGWVQRVAQTPEITEHMEGQSVAEQVAWYANRGYWYDMVASLYEDLQVGWDDNTVTTLREQVLGFVDEGD